MPWNPFFKEFPNGTQNKVNIHDWFDTAKNQNVSLLSGLLSLVYSVPMQVLCDPVHGGELAKSSDKFKRLDFLYFDCTKNKASDPRKSQQWNVSKLMYDVNNTFSTWQQVVPE